jgi:hypothetical protein
MSRPAAARIAATLAALALLVPLPRPALATWPGDPRVNVPVCTAANGQQETATCSDGAGGAIIVWVDFRGGANSDLYAQRISAEGHALWTADGVAVCTAKGDQYAPVIVADGAGGAFIAWEDYRGTVTTIYAQRLNSSGVAAWTANGLLLTNDVAGVKYDPCIAADGTGGCVVAWEDYRLGASDVNIYAQRVTSAGVLWWTSGGAIPCAMTSNQYDPVVVGDIGGAWFAWRDYRSGTRYDIYVNRLTIDGNQVWGNGTAVCTEANSKYGLVMIPDGTSARDVFLAWHDYRNGTDYDIYAQKFSWGGSGLVTGGIEVCTSSGTQSWPSLCSDGAGGAIIAWEDTRNGNDDIYAQRLGFGGVVQWTTNGVGVSTGATDADAVYLAADSLGGAVMAWRDYRRSLSAPDLYAQRLTSTGSAAWTSGGVLIAGNTRSKFDYSLAHDMANGVIVTWAESRVASYDILCQRVDHFGAIGEAEPVVTDVADVPTDQGGSVRLTWTASYLDVEPTFGISEYWLWREVPLSVALAAGAAAPSARAGMSGLPGGYLVTTAGATSYAWEYLDALPASAFASYSYVAPTAYDSMAGQDGWTRFMVQARSGSRSSYYWSSDADSGYSVDNLAPAQPAPFSGTFAAGSASLHWGRNTEADFAEYRLYRGTSPGFAPATGCLVVAQPDTGYVDASGGPYYYKLAAVDVHGNVSPFALLQPDGTSGVPGMPLRLALQGVRPNPSSGRELRVGFSLPSGAPARLQLVDVSGRSVSAVDVGALGAGTHALDLAVGRQLAPGLYVVRLTQGGEVRTARVTLLP